MGTARKPPCDQSGCGWMVRRELGRIGALRGGSVEHGAGSRRAAALAHVILIGNHRLQRTKLEAARFGGNREAGGKLRFQTLPSGPIPSAPVMVTRMGSGAKRRVMAWDRTPAGRLLGGASSRGVGIPRAQLRALRDVAPAMLPPMMRSDRARRGGRRARCRVPRGGGSSEGRLGGGHRHGRCGRFGHAREGERCRCDHKSDQPTSIHVQTFSRAPGPSGALLPLSPTPSRRSGFPPPRGARAGSAHAQLTKPLELAKSPRNAPEAGNRIGFPPAIGRAPAPEPRAEARADRDR